MFASYEDQLQVGVFGNIHDGESSPKDLGVDLESALTNSLNEGCRGFSSVHSECRILRHDIKADISFIESMERDLAIQMMKDKVELRRGLRNLNPNNKSILVKRLTKAERRAALKHVKDRVRKFRRARKGIVSPSHSKENEIIPKQVSKKAQKSAVKHSMNTRSSNRKKQSRLLCARNIQPTNWLRFGALKTSLAFMTRLLTASEGRRQENGSASSEMKSPYLGKKDSPWALTNCA